MNIKELIIPVSLALLTTWVIHHFFLSNRQPVTGSISSGQQFTAPKSKQEVKPLNTEIDFIDTKREKLPVATVVKTKHAEMTFSTEGASLERMIFTRRLNGKINNITTIFPVTQVQREKRAFLLALNEKTPYFYDLVEKKESEKQIDLTYKVKTDTVEIVKSFTIYKDIFQIDLSVSIKPLNNNVVEARLFYPAPVMPEIESYDVISAVFNTQSGSVKKVTQSRLDLNQGWFYPTIFGAENKYFLNTLAQDQDQFVQRAYYDSKGKDSLICILEGVEISEPKQWKMTFYFGPKEEHALVKVNKRLGQVMDYSGILAPVSRFLLAILNFLFKYVHNYGFAIIILTVLIKLILLPFTWGNEKNLKKRAEFQKKLAYIKQRYKNDPDLLERERTELIRKHGMGGMLVGCLPLLLQAPIFIALNRVLSSSIQLYEAPFAWITNLAATDPYFILPLIITLSMLAQALIVDPKQRLYIAGFGIVMGAVSSYFSAGLALYLAVNNVVTVSQVYIQRSFKK